jgi:hypothetical protein
MVIIAIVFGDKITSTSLDEAIHRNMAELFACTKPTLMKFIIPILVNYVYVLVRE